MSVSPRRAIFLVFVHAPFGIHTFCDVCGSAAAVVRGPMKASTETFLMIFGRSARKYGSRARLALQQAIVDFAFALLFIALLINVGFFSASDLPVPSLKQGVGLAFLWAASRNLSLFALVAIWVVVLAYVALTRDLYH